MTREHLIEDIQNVLQMSRENPDHRQTERLRRAFEGLYRHVQAEANVPERVRSCLEESIRVLPSGAESGDEDHWDYARTCLEAALDFAREQDPPVTPTPQ